MARKNSRKHEKAALKAAIKAIPHQDRSTYRQLSGKLGLPKSTIHRYAKRDGVIRRHNSYADPNRLISIYNQGAQSPDHNICDLAFRAIQSIQQTKPSRTVEELIQTVNEAWEEYEPSKMFLTLQTCLDETLKGHGHNYYDIPHLGMSALQHQGNLPETLPVSAEAMDARSPSSFWKW